MEKKTVNVKELIDWHNKERRLHLAASMSIGESLIKAKFHDEAVKLLTSMARQIAESPPPEQG